MTRKVGNGKKAAALTANVVLEFSMYEATSEEILDAYSDEVLEAIDKKVADIALGPAMTLNPHASSIKLRFDVVGKTQSDLYGRVAKVMRAITQNTGLELHADRSRVEAHPEGAEAGDFAVA